MNNDQLTPSLEEMIAAVKAVYPKAIAFYHNIGINTHWSLMDGDMEIVTEWCGAMYGVEPIWRRAYNSLPTTPVAPVQPPSEPNLEQKIAEIHKHLPYAKVMQDNVRGSRGFRYWVEESDRRLSAQHKRPQDAWDDAYQRVIGDKRCENCGKPITQAEGVWVHPNGDRTCWWQPEDGQASPADPDRMAKMADEEIEASPVQPSAVPVDSETEDPPRDDTNSKAYAAISRYRDTGDTMSRAEAKDTQEWLDTLKAKETPVQPEEESRGDWPEDAPHKNGNYWHTCCRCGRHFIGHKRRVECKTCANKTGALSPSPIPASQPKSDVETLRSTLEWVLNDVQEWCEAVNADASWDGWDSHYKSFMYGGLDKARAALAAALEPKVIPASQETPEPSFDDPPRDDTNSKAYAAIRDDVPDDKSDWTDEHWAAHHRGYRGMVYAWADGARYEKFDHQILRLQLKLEACESAYRLRAEGLETAIRDVLKLFRDTEPGHSSIAYTAIHRLEAALPTPPAASKPEEE